MSEKRVTMRERRARSAAQPLEEPAEPVEVVRVEPVRAPVITRIGVTIAPEDLAEARAAFLSDLDRLPAAPQSMTQWVVRAVQAHLDRSPEARRVQAAAHPGTGSTTRKIPYNAPVPLTMKADLADAVVQERLAGRVIAMSGLVREAVAIEVSAARRRAGGRLPVVEGPLAHAR